MNLLSEPWFTFALGIVLPTIAYFGKRLIERQGSHEKLDRTEKVLRLNKEMQAQGLSMSDVEELERFWSDKSKSQALLKAEINAIREGPSERGMSQAEMNISSGQDFEKSDLELKHEYQLLEYYLDDDGLKRLQESQQAWLDYREKQIQLAAGFYEGGSIMPLIANMEAQTITYARINELKEFRKELASR